MIRIYHRRIHRFPDNRTWVFTLTEYHLVLKLLNKTNNKEYSRLQTNVYYPLVIYTLPPGSQHKVSVSDGELQISDCLCCYMCSRVDVACVTCSGWPSELSHVTIARADLEMYPRCGLFSPCRSLGFFMTLVHLFDLPPTLDQYKTKVLLNTFYQYLARYTCTSSYHILHLILCAEFLFIYIGSIGFTYRFYMSYQSYSTSYNRVTRCDSSRRVWSTVFVLILYSPL